MNKVFDILFLCRFGLVQCVMALENISRGEEIFANYGYNPDSDFSPRWFVSAFNSWRENERAKTMERVQSCLREPQR